MIFDIGGEAYPSSECRVTGTAGDILTVSNSSIYCSKPLEQAAASKSSLTRYGFPSSGGSSGTITANSLYMATLQIEAPVTLTGVIFGNAGTANGNVNVGLYNQLGTTLLASSGSVAQTGTWQPQVVPFSAPVALTQGIYIIAIIPSSSTATFLLAWAYSYSLAVTVGSFSMPPNVTPPTKAQSVSLPIMVTY